MANASRSLRAVLTIFIADGSARSVRTLCCSTAVHMDNWATWKAAAAPPRGAGEAAPADAAGGKGRRVVRKNIMLRFAPKSSAHLEAAEQSVRSHGTGGEI